MRLYSPAISEEHSATTTLRRDKKIYRNFTTLKYKIFSSHLFSEGEPITTAEKIYQTVKEFPEPMLHEVLDFAELLKQKTIPDEPQSGNLAILIHNRFKGLDADNLPIPSRQLSRNPPSFEE